MATTSEMVLTGQLTDQVVICPMSSAYVVVHSFDSNSACSLTVSTALSCLSGGYPCFLNTLALRSSSLR